MTDIMCVHIDTRMRKHQGQLTDDPKVSWYGRHKQRRLLERLKVWMTS